MLKIVEANSQALYSPRVMGMSMAATWSWGASILVGISIVVAHGLFPYLVWLVGNILAIPFFGLVYKYLPNARFWKNLIPFVFLWVFIQSMAIIMNMNFLHGVLSGRQDLQVAFALDPMISLVLVYLMGLGLWFYISKKRLAGSVFTDRIQYGFQLTGAILLAIVALSTGLNNFTLVNEGSWNWTVFAFLGIITGVTAAGQQWQRLESVSEEDKFKTTLWGGGYFGFYMIFCALIAVSFTGNLLETILLMIIVLFVTSSTIDSGYAGLQYIGELFRLPKWIPNAFSLLVLAFFPLVTSWGIVQIWNFYAGVRWRVVTFLIVMTLIWNYRRFLTVDYWRIRK